VTIQLLHGFSLMSLNACSTFVVAANVLLLPTSSVVCHKDLSSDRSFSLFIPLIWRRSLLNTDCRYTNMPMTVKYTVPASLMPHLLCRPTSQNVLMTCIVQLDAVNRLQLNGEKTEMMWCSSTRRLSQLPNSSIVVAGANVHPVSTVRDLGVYTDSDLGSATHVRKTVSCCFAALRQLRQLRRYVTDDWFRSLVVSLIHSTLDYGNFVLVGLPAYIYSDSSSLSSTLRLVWCFGFAAMTTLPLLKLNYVLFSSLWRIHWCVAICAVNRLAP